MIFVADQFLSDFIIRQRQFTRKDDKEAFDLRVIDAFLEGIGEGLGGDLSKQWNTLLQTYRQHALFFPLLQYKLWLGALDGIAEEGADILVFLTQVAEDPQAFFDQIMEAIRHGIIQPQSSARQFGTAIGVDLKQQVETLITPKNQENPGELLYELGKIVGPVVLNIILAILAPEAYILRGVAKVGGKLLDFVDDFFGLKKIGAINWKPSIAENLDDVDALARIGEILHVGAVRLEGGHEIRIIDNMLCRSSDNCSILAHIYSPVLYNNALPNAEDLRELVQDLQTSVDKRLQKPEVTKEVVLVEFHKQLENLNAEINAAAKSGGIMIPDALREPVRRLLVDSFKEDHEAIGSFLANGQEFAEMVAAQPQGVKSAFVRTWRQRRTREYRDGAIQIMQLVGGGPTPGKIEQALAVLYNTKRADLEQSLGRILDGLGQVTRRAVRVTQGKAWRNQIPNFLTRQEFDDLPNEGFIDPSRLRFGQENAGYVFDDPTHGNIEDLVSRLTDPNWTNDMWLEEDFDRVKIVLHPNGRVYTLDHRRVIAGQAAAMTREGLEIPFTKMLWEHLPPVQRAKIVQVGEMDGSTILVR